jgi:hypothetical protein
MCRFEHQLKNLVLCLHSVSNELPSSEFQKGPKLEQLTMIPKLGNRPYSRARPLAAHNADNPAGGSPAMVNDDKPSSYNRRG